MRLDLFLSRVGIVKRRTEAARLLRDGRVMVDGRPGKPAAAATVGQHLEVRSTARTSHWRILDIPTGNVRKSDFERYAARLETSPGEPA